MVQLPAGAFQRRCPSRPTCAVTLTRSLDRLKANCGRPAVEKTPPWSVHAAVVQIVQLPRRRPSQAARHGGMRIAPLRVVSASREADDVQPGRIQQAELAEGPPRASGIVAGDEQQPDIAGASSRRAAESAAPRQPPGQACRGRLRGSPPRRVPVVETDDAELARRSLGGGDGRRERADCRYRGRLREVHARRADRAPRRIRGRGGAARRERPARRRPARTRACRRHPSAPRRVRVGKAVRRPPGGRRPQWSRCCRDPWKRASARSSGRRGPNC